MSPTAAESMYPNGPSGKMGNQQLAQEKFPDIDHEAPEVEDVGKNFEGLYAQLRSLKGKVKPGNLLRLYDKGGNEFYYQRNDNYEHGFSWHPKPPKEMM
jgi:hypothetical protein